MEIEPARSKLKIFVSPDTPSGTWTIGDQHPTVKEGVKPILDADGRLADEFMSIGIIQSTFRRFPGAVLYLLINRDDLEQGAWGEIG